MRKFVCYGLLLCSLAVLTGCPASDTKKKDAPPAAPTTEPGAPADTK